MLRAIAKLCARLRRSEDGGILIEAAFSIPIAIVLLLAGFEIARLTLLHQKLDRTASQMADLVSQAEDLTSAQLTDMFNAAGHIMEPFALGGDGVVIVTSMGTVGANPTTVYWQRTGGGTLSATSLVGQEGANATLPTGLTVRSGEGLIAAEIYYNYQPIIFWQIVEAKQLYHRAFFRPRFGALAALQ